jgi:hypothetical protein
LLPEVERAREEWGQGAVNLEAILQPRIDGNIQACQLGLDALVELHREIVETTDIDLEAETRWVAIWEMCGRCIALANALLDQLRSGYATETTGTARVLHEAIDLALAVAEGPEELVRRWLRGKQISPKRASAEAHRFYERLTAGIAEQGQPLEEHPTYKRNLPEMAKLGIPIDQGAAGAIRYTSARAYGALSSGVHNRRAGVRASASPELRQFSYGPHPDPRIRADFVEEATGHIERTLLDVGTCLAEILGVDRVRPIVIAHTTAIHVTRDEQSLRVDVRPETA